MAGPAERIAALIEPAVEDMGFELVRVQLMGDRKAVLQVMAERPDGTMSVEDCADLSGVLSALLDVEDPIKGEYVLEISSPGIDRPLTRPKDFTRWAGFTARLETDQPIDGRRRFKGRLEGLDGENVLIETQEGPAIVPLARVEKAKLVLTDDLLAASQQAEQSGERHGDSS